MMICCGIDPSLAVWLAESEGSAPEDNSPLLGLIVLVATSLVFALAAVLAHP